MIALGFLALLTYIGLVVSGLKVALDRENEFALRNLDNLARVLEAHAHNTVDKIDTVLLASQLRLNTTLAGESADAGAINAALGSYLALIASESQSLRVANAEGNFTHDASGKVSSVHIHDRDYFLRNREGAAELVISEPLFARITSNWVITLSRRLDDRQGQFAGLVQAAIRADHFQEFFTSLKLGPGQSVALVDRERRLIARYPAAPEHRGKALDSPPLAAAIAGQQAYRSFTHSSPVDGLERLYVARQVGHYPLYVVIGHAPSDYLANWYQQVLWSVLGMLLLALVLGGWIGVWLRIYDRAHALAQGMTRAYENTTRQTRALLDSLPDPAWLSDREQRLIAVNDAYARACGQPADTLPGQTVAAIWPSEAAESLTRQESMALTELRQQRRTDAQQLADGTIRHFEFISTPVLDERGELAGVAGVARDITQLHEDQERIRYLAEHDQLTQLPNRGMLADLMSQALALTVGSQAEVALMFLDLDHFKNVNDTLGHEIGDQLLLQAAQRLRRSLDARDTVSRQGGDEFAILIQGYGSPSRLASIAQRLIDALGEPFMVAGHELRVGASIGISTYPQDGQDIGSLLKNADTAMYQAKAAGGNAYRFFMPEMNTRISERVMLENCLRRALRGQDIYLNYQPQVDAQSGRLIGLEALVRWNHPEKGNIPPSRFIPIAEESNLINQLGDWVLHEACRQNRQWQDQGLPPVVMAVNLSAVQLRQANLAQRIIAILADTGLEACWLELEITESAFIHDTDRIVAVLDELSALGIKLSIDDFGTGYSSLAYLKRLPFDRIKIDQSFVRELPGDTDDIAIVRAIIAIADSLQKEVIAEGVEQAKQAAFLLDHGCRLMQGYHFSRPTSAVAIEAVLQQGGCLPAPALDAAV
ncbi:MAG: GGDEF domain-containing protein [Betaproteobacteria bacterium HGW-Betaproteobacteria-4]|nr:MAG: GGDEF domain-containing protein [Betaproteobacteria bacterium HGW-Betaproteobacteria-4]